MTEATQASIWAYRIAFIAAVVPLAYWLLVTFYAVFFFGIAPAWALPLAIVACGVQIVGLSVAKGEMASGAIVTATKRAASHAVGFWSITIAFVLLAWK
ncbi:hypothetical protein K3181_10185 [Qipengyuania sp. YG27]|uniref:Uncharacterized protein n=1 Tax=Qipengyuania mesophila TaxID=2867246 RepID=A0ABS7JW63_9SPHN|nr:hypothetical protein [Qipengyuania mesophila]MBX7501808.1 hypothetical protein [Qipengyuania mesophila]